MIPSTSDLTTRPPFSEEWWEAHEAKIAQIDREAALERARAECALRKRRWMEVPEEYRAPLDPTHPGFHVPADIVAYCRAWQPEHRVGIGIMGDPGNGKTRLLVDILRRLSCDFMFLPAWRFSELVKESAYHDRQQAGNAQHALRVARTCSVLLLDDIGDIKATAAVVGEFKALTDYRCHRAKPILWNGNPSREALFGQYGDNAAMLVQMEASIRRLTDFSWMPGDVPNPHAGEQLGLAL